MATYFSEGSKEWIEATVTLDGTSYPRTGLRLKGNSTLRNVGQDATAMEVPWLLRLDKFVEGQNHQGVTELVIRTNNSTTSLNEVVALDLLGTAGLATQGHAYAAVTVNKATPVLRVIVENPGDAWVAREIATSGVLYKAESTGDYTYRGTDPASYDGIFDQESGDTDDLTPLIAFLKFVNDSSDTEFASGLAGQLDVDAFATYLAFEELVDNYDAIDGPGNNSYLWWDASAKRMTVIGWDHNLTFGVTNGPGAGGGGNAAGGGPPPGGGPGGGPTTKDNPLASRFKASTTFAAKITTAKATLTESLVTKGAGTTSLAAWVAVLNAGASNLVTAEQIATDQASIAAYLK